MTDSISDMIRLQMFVEVDTFLRSIGISIRAAIVFQTRLLAVRNQKDFFEIYKSKYLQSPYYLVPATEEFAKHPSRLTFICDDDFAVHHREHDQFWLYDLTPRQLEDWTSRKSLAFPTRVISL